MLILFELIELKRLSIISIRIYVQLQLIWIAKPDQQNKLMVN
jgi:hypothetical protein